MEDPNKLLAELRAYAAALKLEFEDRPWLYPSWAEKFERLDNALSSGMFFPDDWCRTKIKGEDS